MKIYQCPLCKAIYYSDTPMKCNHNLDDEPNKQDLLEVGEVKNV